MVVKEKAKTMEKDFQAFAFCYAYSSGISNSKYIL